MMVDHGMVLCRVARAVCVVHQSLACCPTPNRSQCQLANSISVVSMVVAAATPVVGHSSCDGPNCELVLVM